VIFRAGRGGGRETNRDTKQRLPPPPTRPTRAKEGGGSTAIGRRGFGRYSNANITEKAKRPNPETDLRRPPPRRARTPRPSYSKGRYFT